MAQLAKPTPGYDIEAAFADLQARGFVNLIHEVSLVARRERWLADTMHQLLKQRFVCRLHVEIMFREGVEKGFFAPEWVEGALPRVPAGNDLYAWLFESMAEANKRAAELYAFEYELRARGLQCGAVPECGGLQLLVEDEEADAHAGAWGRL